MISVGAAPVCVTKLEANSNKYSSSLGMFSSKRPAKKKKAPKPIKHVFAITLTEPGPFAFAGIEDSWKRLDGTRLETFALVTTEPNELVAQIHDRPALILHPRDYNQRLGIPEMAIRGLRSICCTPTTLPG
jgi:putative SOS response-associated peptidase YedK